MSDEVTLRSKAREAIHAGKLPNHRPQRMWGGPGVGSCCPICDQPVKRDELEYELQFVADADCGIPSNCHVHIRCFMAWDSECQRAERAQGRSSSGQPRSATHPATDGGASDSI